MFEADNVAVPDAPPSRRLPSGEVAVRDSVGDDPLDTPLSSIVIRTRRGSVTARAGGSPATARSLALRVLHPAPDRHIPAYVYDPRRQIAITAESEDDNKPDLKKDWTTVEGTHTDGDGGDNELWGWEEIT
jgi:hypothetical protein